MEISSTDRTKKINYYTESRKGISYKQQKKKAA